MLDCRICDLKLSLPKSSLLLADQVNHELNKKHLKIPFQIYLSNDWFNLNNSINIAIPFYLANPILIKLAKKHLGYTEGSNKEEFLKLLRHEIGHIIDDLFKLRRLKQRSRIFGKSSIPYPKSYTYNPYTKYFVHNLDDFYAQSHPFEDFAETFAVWLDPKSNWREKYIKWPAFKKLEYIDKLMESLVHKHIKITTKGEPHSINEIKLTLREYFQKKNNNQRSKRKNFVMM